MMQYDVKDISAQVFGKYQFCTKAKDGLWYADADFERPGGFGNPKRGAMPAPNQHSPELNAKADAVRKNGGYGWSLKMNHNQYENHLPGAFFWVAAFNVLAAIFCGTVAFFCAVLLNWSTLGTILFVINMGLMALNIWMAQLNLMRGKTYAKN